jgi:hypothetical protein
MESIMGKNLSNYDREDVEMRGIITVDSSPEPTLPSLPRRNTQTPATTQGTKSTSPRTRHRPAKPRVNVRPTPYAAPAVATSTLSRPTTPPLAMIDTYQDHLFSPVSSHTSFTTVPSELTFSQRQMAIMAIQEQIDWGSIEGASGVPVEKLLRWWMKASSEMVKRG